jgi:hypothetical protein
VDGNQGRPLGNSAALTLRLLTGQPAEMAALQCVLEAAPDYFLRVTGTLPEGALAFWRRLGYRETGQLKPRSPEYVREVVVLEKPVASRGE